MIAARVPDLSLEQAKALVAQRDAGMWFATEGDFANRLNLRATGQSDARGRAEQLVPARWRRAAGVGDGAVPGAAGARREAVARGALVRLMPEIPSCCRPCACSLRRARKTWLRSATPRSLAELAGLHRGARVTAFVQPGDMALAAAPPPLTPARLKVAAAGAVELLALGDADALLVAHGARADGNVCLAWIAREQAERAQALIEGCGLTAAARCRYGCRAPDGWTLMQGDDWVALRAGSDHVEIHAIARTDMPSGDVSRADTGAMDSVGGHAAGADKPGVGSSGADIPVCRPSCARWRPPDRRGSSGSAGFHPGGPMTCPLNRAARSRLAPMSHQAGM